MPGRAKKPKPARAAPDGPPPAPAPADPFATTKTVLEGAGVIPRCADNEVGEVDESRNVVVLAECTDERLPVDLASPLQVLGSEIGRLASSSNLFRQGREYVTVNPATGETEPMDADAFCSWVESYARTYKMR